MIIDLRTRQIIPSGSLPEQQRDPETAAKQQQIAEASHSVRAIYGPQDLLLGAIRWYRRHDKNTTPPGAA